MRAGMLTTAKTGQPLGGAADLATASPQKAHREGKDRNTSAGRFLNRQPSASGVAQEGRNLEHVVGHLERAFLPRRCPRLGSFLGRTLLAPPTAVSLRAEAGRDH